jgi:F0F1-type ATP synthase epsilon subunit
MLARNTINKIALTQTSARFFAASAKLEQMEMTMRTPYRTLFEGFGGFEHIYVKTIRGQQAIVNNGIPAVYLLPAGQIEVVGMTEAGGKKTESTSGLFMHTGGWVHVHE